MFDQTLSEMNLLKGIFYLKEQMKKIYKMIYFFNYKNTHLYIAAYKMFLDHKILGVGVRNFRNFL